ncbi:MAG TPA: T9SS type A sorting domain-containing protein [Paludibacter sp.]
MITIKTRLVKIISLLVFILLVIPNHSFAQFTLNANVPASTNICYAAGNFNSWSPSSTQMSFVSNNIDGTKTFTLNLPLTFLNSGTFKILSGPEWSYQQTDPQFSALTTGISQTVTVTNFSGIYVPPVVETLSANNTIYISSETNCYSYKNYDFLFYNLGGDTFAGVIITSLPSNGTLNYNNVAVSQSDVTQATVFTDRTKFTFIPDLTRTGTSFTFKVKDSKSVLSKYSYIQSIKYNTPVSRVVRTDNTIYLEHQGLPYLMYAIQLRVDDYASSPIDSKWANVYQYFQKTQQAGFKDAIVPVSWSWFEVMENSFNYKFIDDYLAYAKTYDLHLQLMWFGSNVCAYQYVPNYISSYTKNSQGILDYSNSNLIAKEVRAVKNLITYIATHDTEKRIVLMQVENEPDHHGPATDLWGGGQKEAAIHMMDTLGQVIHASDADMITRVNLTGYTSTADDFANVKGINIVGRDLYTNEYSSFLDGSSKCDAFWNYNHTPENGAVYRNSVNLALSAFERANGYLLYELRTTGWRATTSSENGLYRKTTGNDWIDRDGTQTAAYWENSYQQEVNLSEIKAFNEMIYKADKRIAVCPASEIIAFNLNDQQGTVNETKSFSSYTITYTSSVGGEAMVFEDVTGEIVLMALKDNSSFLFQSLPPNLNLSIGYFDDMNVWHQTGKGNIVDNKVTLNAKEVALLTSKVYETGTSSLPTVKKSSSINIYPNPNQGLFNLNMTSLDFTPKLMEVFNLNAQLVYTQILSGKENSFNIPSLDRGMYVLKLSGINTSKTFINKLIVQ